MVLQLPEPLEGHSNFNVATNFVFNARIWGKWVLRCYVESNTGAVVTITAAQTDLSC